MSRCHDCGEELVIEEHEYGCAYCGSGYIYCQTCWFDKHDSGKYDDETVCKECDKEEQEFWKRFAEMKERK